MKENAYQAYLVKRLHDVFPGAVVLKNDPSYLQGIPDLLILYNDRWAMLEVKAHERYRMSPNQEYYMNKLNGMSFAAFIYPENEEEVFDALQQTFSARRSTRLSKR